ncbi:hypothetical protein HMPREF9695_02408 [Afipia broomeae ATCC 49717]|jgi:hypothetical protein|uniref:Uncharacterized protein n=1 Tax=Afipia broomeae ATCC 49717 TaxID=883078 RepID=K8PJK4_9BRAD|nr:hypothetical protein HMPREF9695_02408 [Afipia broomeae ATCC 49717]
MSNTGPPRVALHRLQKFYPYAAALLGRMTPDKFIHLREGVWP